jgi:glyoxylase-like metal-dependent hydrolase (beta-lactamase superfamily II)
VLISLMAFGGGPLLAEEPEYPAVSVQMKAQRVSEHVYYVQGFPGTATEFEGFVSNAAFVVTDAGVVVFDALGSPSLAAELRKRIGEITAQPIAKVVVSHYHADHIYGLQVFKDAAVEVMAPAGALEYLDSANALERLEERRFSLDPWVNEMTRLVRPDRIVAEDTQFELGGLNFQVSYLGAAHSDGDLSLYVLPDRVLLSGDIIFEGRLPYVGDADTRQWLAALTQMTAQELTALVPGHGPAARDPNVALLKTREYLAYLREVMGIAVAELEEFANAYEAADWSAFEKLPAFEAANRRNAYQVYLSMERELMAGD